MVIIVVDEAAKMTEPELWPAFGVYNPDVYLLVGDQFQLRPFILSSQTTRTLSNGVELQNGFAAQLSRSFYSRAIDNGHPFVMFDTQHRMTSEIAEVVNKVFYRNTLKTAETLDPLTLQVSKRIQRYNKKALGVKADSIFVHVGTGVCSIDEAASRSRFNVENMAWVLNMIRDLLTVKPTTASEILILVPYLSQWERYRMALHAWNLDKPALKIDEVKVRTIDPFQGGEHLIVFLDLVVTDSLGNTVLDS